MVKLSVMVNYRRNKSGNPNEIYFFTIVTQNRTAQFNTPADFSLLISAVKHIHFRFEIKLKAWTFLPDHLHLLINPRAADYSKVISSLKKGVSLEFKNRDRIKAGEKFWQDRFRETTIRDDEHYNNCVEYIHYNPVKHGLVRAPADWEHSSIHKYIERGYITQDWGDGRWICLPGAEYD